MYPKIAALGIIVLLFTTTACTYESLPEPSAATVSPLVSAPPLIPRMSAEKPLATVGPCSIAEVKRKLDTGFMSVADVDYSMFGGSTFNLDFTWRVILTDGLVLSLPDKTYEFLRMSAPIRSKQSTQVLPVTKKTFESLLQAVPSIKPELTAIAEVPIRAYYLTSYTCLPPSVQIR